MADGRLHAKLPADLEPTTAAALLRGVKGDGVDELVTESLLAAGTARNLQHAETLVSNKLRNKVVLLDQPDRTAKRSPGTAKLKRPPLQVPNVKYNDVLPLRELWHAHARQVLETADGNPAAPAAVDLAWVGERVTRMDLHGAVIKVIRAKDPSLLGKEGIVIMETAHTFLIVTEQDRNIRIPKIHIVFNIQLSSMTLSINGGAIAYRASERSARRFKKKPIDPL